MEKSENMGPVYTNLQVYRLILACCYKKLWFKNKFTIKIVFRYRSEFSRISTVFHIIAKDKIPVIWYFAILHIQPQHPQFPACERIACSYRVCQVLSVDFESFPYRVYLGFIARNTSYGFDNRMTTASIVVGNDVSVCRKFSMVVISHL